MRDKILIIGASSKVAQSISEMLTNYGFELIGTYNKKYPQNPECYKKLKKINFVINEDINKLDKLKNISDIIFTIGKAEFLNEEASKINYKALENLVSYLKKKKKNIRIIFCSSSAVYGNNKSKIIFENSNKIPTSYYGNYKLKAENILKKSYIDFVIVRFPIIFGLYFKKKFNRFIEAIKDDKATMFGDGSNNFSFIHQNDLSNFIMKIIENIEIKNEDFNIASGFTSQKDYLNLVVNIFNKKIKKSATLKELFRIAQKQQKGYNKSNKKPSLLKEDVISLSRDRIYSIDKAKKYVSWKPKYTINKSVGDTFKENMLLSRWDGIKILKYLYPDKLLPVKIYRNPSEFNPNQFMKKKEEIWSITIRDEEGDIINTDHLFSRDSNNIKKFMINNKKPNKVYIVRLSPPRDDILYYGSFLIDKNNFKNKVIITISKNPEELFVMREEGKSLKLLPRDYVPDYNLIYEGGKVEGEFPKKYTKILEKDIEKLSHLLKKTKREDLTIPVLFIISKKGVQYISLGL